jgi:hypothetical protein
MRSLHFPYVRQASRGRSLAGTVNLIDRERNEARQMEPDVPMAMPFWQRR